MNDLVGLVNKLLVSPFDRACQAALTRIDTSNPEHVEVVEKLCKQHKELFLGRMRREDGPYKAQSITNELHAGLAYYRSRLMKIWKYEKDEADEAFYFPEKAPLDWVWLIDQFIGIQDAIFGGKPYQINPYKITIDLLPDGYFEELLSSMFAKTSQLIAYKQVAKDEKLIIDVATKIESEVKEAARIVIHRLWDLWEKPPFKENLQKVEEYRTWLELKKIQAQIAGLPPGLTLSINTEVYLNLLDSQIKHSEALEKYLRIKVESIFPQASGKDDKPSTKPAPENPKTIKNRTYALSYAYLSEIRIWRPSSPRKSLIAKGTELNINGQDLYNTYLKFATKAKREENVTIEDIDELKKSGLLDDYPSAKKKVDDEEKDLKVRSLIKRKKK